MCVPVHSEKAAAAIIDDYLRQIESCQTKYPDTPGMRTYIASRYRQARRELGYFQEYHGWLLNYDNKTLKPKPAPVSTDKGVKALKRALTPKKLKAVRADETQDETSFEAKVERFAYLYARD